jgi:hypothetical protein
MLRKIFIFLALFAPVTSFSQVVTDDFSDGDFTNNPTWTGNTNLFIVNNNRQLQLNASEAGLSYLSTASPTATTGEMEWQFYIRLAFAPSNNNLARVYLMSNNPDLSGALNGYYLRFGENGSLDAIELYRQTGTTATLVARGTNEFIASSFTIRVKVTKSNAGVWKIFADQNAGTSFVEQASGTDNTHTTSSHFGVYCLYTVSNIRNFYFDDFYAGPIIVDNTPPAVNSVMTLSTTEIRVIFNEAVELTSAQNTANYFANNGLGNPASAIRSSTNLSQVTLTYSTPFSDGVLNTLTISNVKDLAGNTMVSSSHSFSSYTVKSFDVVFNELMVDPSPRVGLPEFEYIELYNRTNVPIDVSNWVFTHGTTTRTIPNAIIQPDSFLVLVAPAALDSMIQFGNVVAVTSLSSSALTNAGTTISLINELGELIHILQYDDTWYQNNAKSDGGWSLEQIDPNNPCQGKSNWRASVHPSGGTPGRRNSINGNNPDLTPPTIISSCIIDVNLLEVSFSETVSGAALWSPSSYFIDNGIGNPLSVSVTSDFRNTVVLFLANDLQTNTNYTLTVNGNISDCKGNALEANASTKFSFYPAKPQDVVINEIMAKPDPVVGLPNEEYFELYNRTDFAINLKGWTVAIGNSIREFPCMSVMPKDYLIVTHSNAAELFSQYGSVLGIPSFPALANSGATIVLYDAAGNIISTVSYTDNWYNNNTKKNGGWSLEQIDPENPCAGRENWTSSNDSKGGTPGKVNSVNRSNPDNAAPVLMRAALLDEFSVMLYFNEPLNPATANNPASYTIDNGIGNPTLAIPQPLTYSAVTLVLPTAIEKGKTYTVTVNFDIKDCVGNSLTAYDNKAKFAIPDPVEAGDIVINEILFNPRDRGVDFVEIYNKSTKVIDLKEMRLSSIDTIAGELTSVREIDPIGFLIFPGEYLVLTTDLQVVQQHYVSPDRKAFLQMASLPSFANTRGSAVLSRNGDIGFIIDQMHYTDRMHFPLLNNLKGVSLERIDPERPSEDQTNWMSASENVGFATPGYRNSQFRITEFSDDAVTIDPQVFSPDNDGYNDVLNISYQFDQPGFVGSITVFDANGRIVRNLMRSQLLGTEGAISWDGINESREKAPIGMYVIFFEAFDLKGNIRKYKKTCVLGGRI